LQNKCKSAKRAAIVEFRPKEWPTYPEMLFFSDLLTQNGIPCELIDLQTSSLGFKDNNLCSSSSSVPIEMVYKRILWEDFSRSHKHSKEALSKAFLSGVTCVVNSLGSRMAGNKGDLEKFSFSARFVDSW